MMDDCGKTDNHDPAGKLALRRYFLDKYHSDGSGQVLDCCQGGGVMWSEIRRTHSVASYWGIDIKPKKGRIKIDSVRVLQQAGWPQNIVDVDTYGSPWKHWLALLPNVQKSTTVYLTIGQNKMVGGFQGKAPREVVESIGLPRKTPPSIAAKLWGLGADYLLAYALEYCKIVECVEAVSNGNARYLGIRLEPKESRPLRPTAACEHTDSEKGNQHV